MVFTSALFLFLFLPICLVVYYLAPYKYKASILCLSGFVFYGMWRLDFLVLLIFSTLVDFTLGQYIYKFRNSLTKKRFFLILSITINLGLLFYFKYFTFIADNLIFPIFGKGIINIPEIILPVGISFFTFQTMSYSIDIYRGQIKPTNSIIVFGSYVSMFPQLVAGPIVRYKDIEDSLNSINKIKIDLNRGMHFFIIGFAKKVLIANNVSQIVDFSHSISTPDFYSSLYGAVAYSIQIYFDFSGYSDMAIGLGLLLGFNFPLNFNSPYKASSITTFWQRWHLSLSTWFRDYLYIPLGGNRKGNYRTFFNLFIVMFLCGVWHGASWNFIVWGGLHGFLLMIERYFKNYGFRFRLPRSFGVILNFVIVTLLWIPFRATDLAQTLYFLNGFFNFVKISDSMFLSHFDLGQLLLVWLSLLLVFFTRNSQELVSDIGIKRNQVIKIFLFLVSVHEMLSQSYNPFLYFNF